jgi:chromosome segregation ATPase
MPDHGRKRQKARWEATATQKEGPTEQKRWGGRTVDDEIIKRLDIHRTELNEINTGVNTCQIAIGQHDERLRAYETNSKRQNGMLDDVAHGINELVKKVDAMDISIANRENQIERNGIGRDVESDTAVRERADNREVHIRAEIAELERRMSEMKQAGAARMAEVERVALESVQRAIDRLAEARRESGQEIAALRVDFIKKQAESTSNLQWKIITASLTVAFFLFIVIITLMTHTFGGLPTLP